MSGFSNPGWYRKSMSIEVEFPQTLRDMVIEQLTEDLEEESRDMELNPSGKQALPVQEVDRIFIYLNKIPDPDSNTIEVMVNFRYRQGLV